MLFDSHCHLNDADFAHDLADVLENANNNGVLKVAVVGCDWDSSKEAVEMSALYPGQVYAIVGVHPHDADGYCDELEESLRQWCNMPGVVCVGEIGLDYYRDLSPRDVQQKVFRRQIRIAQECDMPISVHCRDAMEDLTRILQEENQGTYQGILHCYSGSYEQAVVLLDMGFHISFAGPLTYPNAKKLPKVASNIPLDRILLETDSPYLAPQAVRGKRNEPANVRYVLEKLAAVRGISIEEAEKATYENTLRVFRL